MNRIDLNKKEVELMQQQSVEIGINAKGHYSGKVKVYAVSVQEAWNQAISKAEELGELIRSKNK